MTPAQNSNALAIEITSDFVCPWCYLGEARLEKALKAVAPKVAITWSWKPYELNPSQPKEGVDRQEYMTRRFGAEKVKAMEARMKELGREDGLEFHQELIKRSPNTHQAHRLTWLADKEGKSVARLIFKAYFSDGKDIGSDDVLAALAAEAGMDAKKVRAFLASDEGSADVRKLEELGHARGIEGVPFFSIGDEKIHGAETVEEMTAALQRALKGLKAA